MHLAKIMHPYEQMDSNERVKTFLRKTEEKIHEYKLKKSYLIKKLNICTSYMNIYMDKHSYENSSIYINLVNFFERINLT